MISPSPGKFRDLEPPDGSSELAMELSSGERLIWPGRPQSVRRLVWQSVPKALFGLVMIVFTVIWMTQVARNGLGRPNKGGNVPPFTLENILIAASGGLWMIPPSLYLLMWPLRTWRALKMTHYALTDQRAIIIEPGFLGQTRVRSYPGDALSLMRLEEHRDGTGDLIFHCPATWVQFGQTVGFLGIAQARDVEIQVRRTLISGVRLESGSPSDSTRHPAKVIPVEKTYAISWFFRLFQFVFLAVGLLVGFCLLANLVIGVVVLVLWPKLVLGNLPQELGGLGIVGALVAGGGSYVIGCLVAWGFLLFALAHPIEITINEDRSVHFRSRLRTVAIPIDEIEMIRTGAWYDPSRNQLVIRHKRGKLTLFNQFPDFMDFLAAAKELNPAIEIQGF